VRVRGLTTRFGSRAVFDELDLDIPRGKITAIMGPSGTGKTTLLKHITGQLRADAGELLVDGQDVAGLSREDLFELRERIGYLFQNSALLTDFDVYENVAFPLRQHTDYSEAKIDEVVKQRLADVGLADATYDTPSQLSGGMRKRAGFARALVMEPDIVIFDEPDSGLDPVRTALLCELIQEMHAQLGGTYLVVTHDIASARRIGEYIALLWRGKIVESGDSEKMFSSENPFVRQFLSGAAAGPLGMD